VQLLADEREVDQLDERRLQLVADLRSLVLAKSRQVCLRTPYHGHPVPLQFVVGSL
jgi:hypothetical protein